MCDNKFTSNSEGWSAVATTSSVCSQGGAGGGGVSEPIMRCKHDMILHASPEYWYGGWNGPISKCSCCFNVFGYIDSMSIDSNGCSGKYWYPKNLCGGCGGKYIEHNSGE